MQDLYPLPALLLDVADTCQLNWLLLVSRVVVIIIRSGLPLRRRFNILMEEQAVVASVPSADLLFDPVSLP